MQESEPKFVYGCVGGREAANLWKNSTHAWKSRGVDTPPIGFFISLNLSLSLQCTCVSNICQASMEKFYGMRDA